MYTGAPEKCLEVFALTKKKKKLKLNSLTQNSTPCQKQNKEQTNM